MVDNRQIGFASQPPPLGTLLDLPEASVAAISCPSRLFWRQEPGDCAKAAAPAHGQGLMHAPLGLMAAPGNALGGFANLARSLAPR